MELPKVFNTREGDSRTYFLKLLKNLYNQKQDGRVWNHHLNDVLRDFGFKQSAVNKFVWYRDNIILFYYVNNGIFMGSDPRAINKALEEIENLGLDIEERVNIEDYLGVNIEDQDNGNIKLTQPQIIYIIINDVHLPRNTTPQQIPALSTRFLWHDAASLLFDDRFNYRTVVVKLNLLEKSTISDISYATHQFTHFSQDWRTSHGDVIIHLVKYLKATRTQVITLDPEGKYSFEVNDDA